MSVRSTHRLLLLTGSLGPGGTEIAVFRMAIGLSRRGRFLPHVAVLGSAGPMGEDLRHQGIPVDEFHIRGRLYGPGGLSVLFRLLRLLRDRGIELVHTFLFDADVLGAIAGGLYSVPVITTRRAVKQGRNAQLAAYRWTNRWAKLIVANSEAVGRFTFEVERAPRSKLRVVPNGIETGGFREGNGVAFRKEENVPSSASVIGALGTVKHIKGQDVLFEGLGPVLRERENVYALVAGTSDNPWAKSLCHRIEGTGLASRFRFLGNRPNVADFLAALDVFVLPSRSEGMSNALLEAMASGLPCVATDVGGNSEALAGGAAGTVVPPESPEGIRRAVLDLLDNPEKRSRLGKAARDRARAEYEFGLMLDRTEQLYDGIVGASTVYR